MLLCDIDVANILLLAQAFQFSGIALLALLLSLFTFDHEQIFFLVSLKPPHLQPTIADHGRPWPTMTPKCLGTAGACRRGQNSTAVHLTEKENLAI